MAVGFATQKAEQYQGNDDFFDFKLDYLADKPKDNYCSYERGIDSGYVAFLYIAGMVAALIASPLTRKLGRTKSVLISGIGFCLGAVLNALGYDDGYGIFCYWSGRIMLGVGIGFGIQISSWFCEGNSPISEIAPACFRGGFNSMFQLAISLGIFAANLVNYASYSDKWSFWRGDQGFRLCFGLVATPAFLMIVGGIFVSETPNSLMQGGSKEQARKVLEKIRGTENVEAELKDIANASEFASAVKHPFRSIFQKRNRPQLVMANLMPVFQSLAGVNSLLYNAPIMFLNVGFKENMALYSLPIIGAVLVSSALLSMAPFLPHWCTIP